MGALQCPECWDTYCFTPNAIQYREKHIVKYECKLNFPWLDKNMSPIQVADRPARTRKTSSTLLLPCALEVKTLTRTWNAQLTMGDTGQHSYTLIYNRHTSTGTTDRNVPLWMSSHHEQSFDSGYKEFLNILFITFVSYPYPILLSFTLSPLFPFILFLYALCPNSRPCRK